MKSRTSSTPPASLQRTAWVFTLPHLLPEHTRLLLDVRTRLTILLQMEGEELLPYSRSFQLSPSAAQVFLALLQAYPQHCSYQMLFVALYPASQGEPFPVWEHNVRPIRRALVVLAPILHCFGLEAVALRGHGYLLASSSAAKDPRASLPTSRKPLTH